MPRYVDNGYEDIRTSILSAYWNGSNGVMIGQNASWLARRVYQLASIQRDEGENLTYSAPSDGSSRRMRNTLSSTNGVHRAGLEVIDALNAWDGRSREEVVKSRQGKIITWTGKLAIEGLKSREVDSLAAPYPLKTVGLLEGLSSEPLIAETISIQTVRNIDSSVSTMLNFPGLSRKYVIDPSGLIIPLITFDQDNNPVEHVIDQSMALESLIQVLGCFQSDIREEIAR